MNTEAEELYAENVLLSKRSQHYRELYNEQKEEIAQLKARIADLCGERLTLIEQVNTERHKNKMLTIINARVIEEVRRLDAQKE